MCRASGFINLDSNLRFQGSLPTTLGTLAKLGTTVLGGESHNRVLEHVCLISLGTCDAVVYCIDRLILASTSVSGTLPTELGLCTALSKSNGNSPICYVVLLTNFVVKCFR